MQNLVRKWGELAPFYFRVTATAPLMFVLAHPRRAPPFRGAVTSTGPKVKFHNATTEKTPKRYALKVETFPLLFTFPRFRISQKATKRENSSEKAREQKQRKSFLSIKKKPTVSKGSCRLPQRIHHQGNDQ